MLVYNIFIDETLILVFCYRFMASIVDNIYFIDFIIRP